MKPILTPARRTALCAQGLLAAANLLDEGALVVASVSGGKDSQAMVDYLVQLLQSKGLDPRDRLVLVNSNLGRAEWDARPHLEGMAAHYGGLTLLEVFPKRDLITSIKRRGMWPSARARYCTSDHKRAPIQKEIRRLVKERRCSIVLHCTGERAEESRTRRTFLPFEKETALCTAKRWVYRWRPVLDVEEAAVWSRIAASGYPAHPLYAKGLRRFSCRLCVFGSVHDLRIAKREDPELFAEYVGMELTMGHTFRHGFSLASIDTVVDDGMTGPT